MARAFRLLHSSRLSCLEWAGCLRHGRTAAARRALQGFKHFITLPSAFIVFVLLRIQKHDNEITITVQL